MVARNCTIIGLENIAIGAYVPVGSGTIILPGVEIGEGAAVGAMSLVAGPLKSWTIYAGNPAEPRGERARNVAQLAASLDRDDAG